MPKITIGKTGAGTLTIPREKLERLKWSTGINVNLKIVNNGKKLVVEPDEE